MLVVGIGLIVPGGLAYPCAGSEAMIVLLVCSLLLVVLGVDPWGFMVADGLSCGKLHGLCLGWLIGCWLGSKMEL